MTATHALIGTPDRIPGINVYRGQRIRITCQCGWTCTLRPIADEHLIRHRIRHHLAHHFPGDTEPSEVW